MLGEHDLKIPPGSPGRVPYGWMQTRRASIYTWHNGTIRGTTVLGALISLCGFIMWKYLTLPCLIYATASVAQSSGASYASSPPVFPSRRQTYPFHAPSIPLTVLANIQATDGWEEALEKAKVFLKELTPAEKAGIATGKRNPPCHRNPISLRQEPLARAWGMSHPYHASTSQASASRTAPLQSAKQYTQASLALDSLPPRHGIALSITNAGSCWPKSSKVKGRISLLDPLSARWVAHHLEAGTGRASHPILTCLAF